MLKLDEDFKESYLKYYGRFSPYQVVDAVSHHIQTFPGYTLVNILNLVKTCSTLGQTYTECYMQLGGAQSFMLGGEDVDKANFDVIFKYLHEADPKTLESFLGIRFTVRDIYAELAQDAYGKTDEEAIDKIKAIKTEDTYSIQAPNPTSRDRWFYNLACTVGSYSKCHSRKIGAVLVKDKSVISTGYNGPPRGVPTCDQRWFIDKRFKEKYGHHMLDTEHDDVKFKTTKDICPRRIIGFPSGQGLEVCPAGHAERNALINAARLGIKTDKTKLYMTCATPCTPCMVEIINSGVEEIVCSGMAEYDETSLYLLENSDLKIRIYDFLV
jgi:dCMP deaminase